MTRSRQPTDTTPHQSDGTTFVLGGGLVGREVATLLAAEGATVERVTTAPSAAAHPDHRVHVVDSLDAETLEAVGLTDADAVVVLGAEDARNLLVAQLARSRFGVERVVVRVTDPERRDLFERLDVETLDATDAIARTAVELC
jgi:trk system potassium uptake protein TrkA